MLVDYGYDLEALGYVHKPLVIDGDPERIEAHLPMIHIVFSNLKSWLLGTHHGVRTRWNTTTPLKADLRSHPYPRPAGNHHIRNFTRMDLMNYGVRRRLRAPASGTAVLNARHYVR